MGINRATKRFAAWIACCAILMASLAPSISHALAAASNAGSFWAEICSASGIKLLKVADDAANQQASGSSSPAEKGLQFEHCPFCFTHAASFGLPPSAGFILPVVSGVPMRPSLFYQSPRPLFAWAAAQPRAPPVRS